jgi:hypothetical protein
MTKQKMMKAKKISLICFFVLVSIAVINITISSISIYQDKMTSFPWYAAIYFVGLLYIIPLVIVFSVYLFFVFRLRKQ